MDYRPRTIHKSVLLQEVIDGLAVKKNDLIVDATIGAGGHSTAICSALGGEAKIIGIDADTHALDLAKRELREADCHGVKFIQGNFRDIAELLSEIGVTKVEKVLFDLGLSSMALESSGRGFSFLRDEPLKMTFSDKGKITARDVVNEWSEETLSDILEGFGEERYSKRIAKAITKEREGKEIRTTTELVKIIEDATPAGYRRGHIHPATKTFQAIRMAVNDELGALTQGLMGAYEILTNHGRIAVISFHSVEDRLVKQQFREWVKEKKGELLTKKPITPTQDEVIKNPRSRSAKLRIIKKHVQNQ